MKRQFIVLASVLGSTFGFSACAETHVPDAVPQPDAAWEAAPNSDGSSGLDAGLSDARLQDRSTITIDVTTSDATSLGDGCASGVAKGELVPLDMLIVLDRSGSMASNAKWDSARAAIKAFADSVSGSVNLGLSYFPPTSGGECELSSYGSLAVPIAALPGNASLIKESLFSTTANGANTPMRPALEGTLGALLAHLTKNPLHDGLVVLVTDGEPSGCTSNTVADVASVAADALAATPSIRTFVVGMEGAKFTNLDTIAKAGGGTTTAFDVGIGSAATQALVDAFEQVRTESLACEYAVPNPGEGKSVDYDAVEIQFDAGGDAGTTTSLTKIDSEGNCNASSFFYDNPITPTKITLCPEACSSVKKAGIGASVHIAMGCIFDTPT